MEDRRLNLNERLTLLVGVGALVLGSGSTAVAYLAYRQSQDTADLGRAVRHLGLVAEQAQAQTRVMRDEITVLRLGLTESHTQSAALSRQAQSLAIQAKKTNEIAAANAIMARSSIDALSVQQKSLFFAASPRLTISVIGLGDGRVRDGVLHLGMTLLVSLKGQDSVKDYGVAASLSASRMDGRYKDNVMATCKVADRTGEAWSQQLEKNNEVGLGAEAKLPDLMSTMYADQPPRPDPVFIACASYKSPVDNSLHHVAIVNPVSLVDSVGNARQFSKGDLDISSKNLRRVDFPGYSD